MIDPSQQISLTQQFELMFPPNSHSSHSSNSHSRSDSRSDNNNHLSQHSPVHQEMEVRTSFFLVIIANKTVHNDKSTGRNNSLIAALYTAFNLIKRYIYLTHGLKDMF